LYEIVLNVQNVTTGNIKILISKTHVVVEYIELYFEFFAGL